MNADQHAFGVLAVGLIANSGDGHSRYHHLPSRFRHLLHS